MKLIWHQEKLWEQDWLRYLFGDLVTAEVTDLDWSCFDDDAIHVVNGRSLLASHEEYFWTCRLVGKNIVLVHVGDELFAGGYKMYKYFDLVLRWNHTYLADAPGIITIPLGVPTGTTQASSRPADQRKYAWSFIGQIKSSRIAMVDVFDGFEPQCLIRTDAIFDPAGKKVSKAEFDAVLADSVFSPCPMGNTTIDTHRVYESLELGAIPIVELRRSLNYYQALLGPNPMPAFSNWSEARQFAERMYADKVGLNQLQREVIDWWQELKLKVRAEVQTAIRGPSQAAALQQYAALWRNRHAFVHEPLRMAELLRHQTGSSLLRRITHPGVAVRRIVNETLFRRSVDRQAGE